MMSQRQEMKIDSVGLIGLRTLIEPAGYGFYVFLINKTKKFATALKQNGLLQTYEDVQSGNSEFKSYMIEQLDTGRKILNSDNNKVYMICVTMHDWSKLPSNAGKTELLCPELTEAISNITYGVLRGGKKRHKKSYKRKSNKRSRKTKRYKK
jgi:hypothetical protein